MVNWLIGIHAAFGELGILLFLWVFVELINPDEKRARRAKIAALLGTIMIFAAWIVGGYYYVTDYGTLVKPVIKEGPMPWAHSVFMETKEHVFLFLPFLSLFTLGLLYSYSVVRDKNARLSALMLCALIVLIGLSMVGMGYLISTGARTALEAKVV